MIHPINRALGMVNVFLIAVTTFAAVALFFFTPVARYVWVSEAAGGSIEAACVPSDLARPIYSMRGVANFAKEAVLELNDYDYLTWDTKLNRVTEQYLTESAAGAYLSQFENSNLLAQVRENYYSVAAQALREPIVSQTRDNGTYRSWEVQVPVRVYYQTGARTVDGPVTDQKRTQMLIYLVQVAEQPPNRSHQRGVAIYAISTQQLTSLENLNQLRTLTQ